MYDNQLWVLFLVVLFCCMPFLVFYFFKIAALGWYKGKHFFEKTYIERKNNGKENQKG